MSTLASSWAEVDAVPAVSETQVDGQLYHSKFACHRCDSISGIHQHKEHYSRPSMIVGPSTSDKEISRVQHDIPCLRAVWSWASRQKGFCSHQHLPKHQSVQLWIGTRCRDVDRWTYHHACTKPSHLHLAQIEFLRRNLHSHY